MGDDITIVVPQPETTTEEETTVEEIGEELLSRLDEIDRILGEANVRIAELEGRIAELERGEWATTDHTHEGFALTDHAHDGYAATDHEHEERKTEKREPDKPPEKQHPYFRRIDDF